MNEKQAEIMATFIADENGGEPEDYLGVADITRDPFELYDGNAWREASAAEDSVIDGYPARYFERVQAFKGQQRLALWVIDFGEFRAVYQQ